MRQFNSVEAAGRACVKNGSWRFVLVLVLVLDFAGDFAGDFEDEEEDENEEEGALYVFHTGSEGRAPNRIRVEL